MQTVQDDSDWILCIMSWDNGKLSISSPHVALFQVVRIDASLA